MDRFKRIVALLLMTVMMCAFIPTISAAVTDVVYVSPNGDDGAAGTIDNPLKTFEGALTKVRTLRESGIEVKEVIFREGEYRMRNTTLIAGDSGTEEQPIVYKAYDGETVQFKGSKELDITKAEPVTDQAVLKRVHPDADGRLIQLDLAAQGISKDDILEITDINAGGGLKGQVDYNTLYIDEKEINIAQWPNGDGQYAAWEKSISNTSFQYSEAEPGRWAEAVAKGDMWVGAFPDYDFNYFRESVVGIDIANKIISVNPKASTSFTNPYSKRWKAFNLLEEIDVPGEFYIDRDTMTLYLYPPYTLTDAKVELSLGGANAKSFITGSNFSNITFSGIEFSQITTGGVLITNTNNIDFLDCTFRNIAPTAITMNGTTAVKTGQNPKSATPSGHQALMSNDGAYNTDVKGCVFENIGSYALYLQGGNVDELKPSNHVIENNYFTSITKRAFSNLAAIVLTGVGSTFRKNTLTHSRQQGVIIYGCNNVVEENEVYDILREVGDNGALYMGRSQIERGNVFARNFLHQIRPSDPRVISGVAALYMDDGHHDNTLEQNIVVDALYAYNNNGASAIRLRNNTFVNTNSHWRFHNFAGYNDETVTVSNIGTTDDLLGTIVNKELYFKEFPLLEEWLTTNRNPKYNTVIDGNYIVGDSESYILSQDEKYAQWGNNVQVSTSDAFVDPENLDYRVKSDSAIAKELPGLLDESFDINEIGSYLDLVFNEETAPFRLLYPQNGERISSLDVNLLWQEPLGANSYRVTVAKDADFNDVVYDEVIRYNTLNLGELEKNTRYYWKVNAINTSRTYANEWKHDGAVYTFTTNAYDVLDTENFEFSAVNTENTIAAAEEGSLAGAYKEGTFSYIRRYIDVTRALTKLPLGRYSQTSLDARTNFILRYFKDTAEINGGFVDLSRFDDPSHWSKNFERNVDGSMTLISLGETVGGSNVLSAMAGSVIYCFDMTIENDGSWIIFGMNKNVSSQYNGKNNGYTICSKFDRLELQKQDGSKNNVIEERMGVTLNDGKKHSVMFGYLNTAVGCNIVLVVDGELIFNYADITATAQSGQPMEFVATARPSGAKITIFKSENVPTGAEFTQLCQHLEYTSARAIAKSFPNVTGAKFLKAGSKKVVTEDAVYDVSYATPEMKNDELMVPVAVLAKMFGGTQVANSNSATLKIRDVEFAFNNGSRSYSVNGAAQTASQAPYEKNGYLMVSLEDVLANIGCELTIEWLNNVAVITDTGSVNTVNQGQELRNASTILEKLSTFAETDDVIFGSQSGTEGGEGSEKEDVLVEEPVKADEYIAFLGDSITRNGTFISYLDAFLKTRFPDKKIGLINAGKDGDSAKGMLDRYVEDVVEKGASKAFICFGMNDAVRGYYPNVGSAAQKAAAITSAKENLEQLILKLKSNGINDIVLMTPTTYDDRQTKTGGSTNCLGFGDALVTVSDNVKALAKKYNLDVVDLNTITDDILDRAEKAGDGKAEIIDDDRIHPNKFGHFIIMAEIAEALYGDSGVVASVEINAQNGENAANNATVSNVTTANGGVSYTYQANSLPMGVDLSYERVEERYSKPETGADNGEYVDFTEKMNQEIIKVSNLKAGSYTVEFDGVALGTYTAAELAKGINIATNENNPGQVQAKDIVDRYMSLQEKAAQLRAVENDITWLKQNGMYEGYSLAEMVQWLQANPKGTANGAFLNNHYDKMDTYYKQLWTLDANAYELAQPKAHTVTIKPIG